MADLASGLEFGSSRFSKAANEKVATLTHSTFHVLAGLPDSCACRPTRLGLGSVRMGDIKMAVKRTMPALTAKAVQKDTQHVMPLTDACVKRCTALNVLAHPFFMVEMKL